jgi:predicted ATPase/DNA-binding SARP family transcriptional activator/DNA-binding CsgD family transcriptional regulator
MGEPLALRIRLLGDFRVEVGQCTIAADAWQRRKVAALVKLLVLAPRHCLHREQVLEALWPELTPAAAGNNLHRTLYTARRVLEPGLCPGFPPAFLCLRGDVLALTASAPVWVDVAAFEDAADRARSTRDRCAYETALRLYTGELLPDDRYEDWATAKREELRRRQVELLLELAGVQRAQGDDAAAIATLRQAIAREPAHEEAHLDLMRLYLAGGRRGDALRLYRRLRETLRSEFGDAPDEAIERLYGSILVGAAPADLGGAARAGGSVRPLPSNLPAQLTSFVGREQEVAEITQLLGTTRLLTLVGPGGCGKTRLAIEIAARRPVACPDGVWWLELASLEDETLIPDALARLFGLHLEPGRTALETLGDHLRDRFLLLVLDNCEHLVSACAGLVATLLRAAPGLRVLATSRTALNATGEQIWNVPPLASPDPRCLPPTDRLPDYAAVRLFLDRARAVRPGIELTEADALPIAQICARLEGMPLTIELAAARVRVLTPGQIAARLDDCLGLLSRGSRTVAPRHQTLRGVLDWSHALLSLGEQTVFRRLSVFAGGWTLDAAAGVISAPDGRTSVLDALSPLVDQSLVVVEDVEGSRRYRFLEPIRQYAAEKLRQAGDVADARDRHLAWFLDFAEAAQPEGSERARLARLGGEYDNLRAALGWANERNAAKAGIRLCAALWRLWFACGHFGEARTWLEAFLDRCADVGNDPVTTIARGQSQLGLGVIVSTQGDQVRAKALLEDGLGCFRRVDNAAGVAAALEHLATVAQNQGDRPAAVALIGESLARRRCLHDRSGMAGALHRLGSLSRELGQYRRAYECFDESLRHYRALGDTKGIATVLNTLGKTVRDQGDATRAVVLHEESLALHRELGDAWGISRSLGLLGEDLWYRGDAALALPLLEESLVLAREVHDRWGIAGVLRVLGRTAHALGDRNRAVDSLTASLELCRDLDDAWGRAATLHGLGMLALTAGDWDGAAARYREALLLGRRMDVLWGVAGYLEGAARVAVGRGHAEAGARLYGAAGALRDTVGRPLPVPERASHEEGTGAARSALGAETFAAACTMGRALRPKRAIAEALALLESPSGAERRPSRGSTRGSQPLSRRERQVVALVVRGVTNRTIAAELRIAERTVDTHLANTFRKLGVRTRTELAAWASCLGLGVDVDNAPADGDDATDPAGIIAPPRST